MPNIIGKYWGVLFYQDQAIKEFGVKVGSKFHSSGKTDLDCLAEPLGNIGAVVSVVGFPIKNDIKIPTVPLI